MDANKTMGLLGNHESSSSPVVGLRFERVRSDLPGGGISFAVIRVHSRVNLPGSPAFFHPRIARSRLALAGVFAYNFPFHRPVTELFFSGCFRAFLMTFPAPAKDGVVH
jgi:hypothetical protein